MNVFILTTDFPPLVGGIGTFAIGLGRALQAVGESVRVITPVGARASEPIAALAVTRTLPWLNRRMTKVLPMLWAVLTSVLRRERPDHILCMAWTHEGVVGYLVRRLIGIPYSVVVHGTELVQLREDGTRRALALRILRSAGSVIANSEFTRDVAVALGVARARTAVVYPPFQALDGFWSAEPGLDEKFGITGKRVILTTARLVKRKGHADVIRALAELRFRFPDLVYVMTGEGPHRIELERLARQVSVADRVRMPGVVSPDELRHLHATAEVYVSPSREDRGDVEGFGIALIEAGAHGKPVVAGRTGGVSEAVIDGKTGILIDTDEPAALTKALTLLLDDPALRDRLGRNACARITAELGLERQGRRLVDTLRKAVA